VSKSLGQAGRVVVRGVAEAVRVVDLVDAPAASAALLVVNLVVCVHMLTPFLA